MATLTDPHARAQDVKRCHHCPGKDRKFEAVKVCKTCHLYLCTDCVDLHMIDSPSKHLHDVVTLRFNLYEDYLLQCNVHKDSKCDMFCTDCDSAICLTCVSSGDHENHNVQQRINPLARAQDVVRCQICPGKFRKSFADIICITCHVNLYKSCVDLHMIDTFVVHDFGTYNYKYFEINRLPCIAHETFKCDRFCRDCDVAVCDICHWTRSHRNHNLKRRAKNHENMQPRSGADNASYPVYLGNLKKWMLSFISCQCLGVLALVVMCCILLYLCQYDHKYSGEFKFERTYLESIQSSIHAPKAYKRAAILKGDFKNMETVRIGIETENTNSSRDHKDRVIFQISFERQERINHEIIFISKGIVVSAEYCKNLRICLIVKNETNVLFMQEVSSLSIRSYFLGVLSFVYIDKSAILHLYFQSIKPICTPLAIVPLRILNTYDFVARLGPAYIARSVMTFHESIIVSNQVHKEMHMSSDGKALGNYDIEYLNRGSFVNIGIHKTIFHRLILLYEVSIKFKLNSKNIVQEKELFDVGLAPMNLKSKNMMLRNSNKSVFIQVSIEYLFRIKRVFHIYIWKNGKKCDKFISYDNYLEKETFRFIFKFDMNLLSKRVTLCSLSDNLKVLENVEFDSILYPSAGKETSLYPITISYKLWEPDPV